MTKKHVPVYALFGPIDNIKPACILETLAETPERLADYQMSYIFLNDYIGSIDTFNAYRREVERFLQWLWWIREANLSDIGRQDIHDYFDFLKSPPHSWIGRKQVRRFRTVQGQLKPNSEWRPFTFRYKLGQFKADGVYKTENETKKRPKKEYNLSEKSIKATFSILSAYFSTMVQEGAMDINPVAMIKQKSRYIEKSNSSESIRRLTPEFWQMVIEIAKEDCLEKGDLKSERALFILSLLYLTACRISEIATKENNVKWMSDFHEKPRGVWWFKVVGKGNKKRNIPVNTDLLNALQRYRLKRNLSPLPLISESVSLLHSNSHSNSGISSRMIRYIVSDYFNKAIAFLKTVNLKDAYEMQQATVHWLRHTSISDQYVLRSDHHLQKDAGHADRRTTDSYNEIEDLDRHQSMELLHLSTD